MQDSNLRPRITKAGQTDVKGHRIKQVKLPKRPTLADDPAAFQAGASPPIGRSLPKARWLGKSREIDLRYTCANGSGAQVEPGAEAFIPRHHWRWQ